MSGSNSALQVILSSGSISDFFARMDMLAKIANYDNQIIDNIKSQRNSIALEKTNLQAENNAIANDQKAIEQSLKDLNAEITSQNKLLVSATQKENSLLAQKASMDAAAAAAAAAKAAAQANASVVISPPVKGTTITMDATAYDKGGATSYGIQTSRNPSGYSTVAVFPGTIPLGTKLYIAGYGYAIAADTGTDIIGNRIDLFFNTDADCNSFGRKNVQVTILN